MRPTGVGILDVHASLCCQNVRDFCILPAPRNAHPINQLSTEIPEFAPFCWPIRVYYEDTDAGGIVYHAAYLHFLERARTEWLRALGFEQDALRQQQGLLFAVRRMELDYLRAARFNQALTVETRLVEAGGASLELDQRVLDEDGTEILRGLVRVACIDAERLRPKRIPKNILMEIARGH